MGLVIDEVERNFMSDDLIQKRKQFDEILLIFQHLHTE